MEEEKKKGLMNIKEISEEFTRLSKKLNTLTPREVLTLADAEHYEIIELSSFPQIYILRRKSVLEVGWIVMEDPGSCSHVSFSFLFPFFREKPFRLLYRLGLVCAKSTNKFPVREDVEDEKWESELERLYEKGIRYLGVYNCGFGYKGKVNIHYFVCNDARDFDSLLQVICKRENYKQAERIKRSLCASE